MNFVDANGTLSSFDTTPPPRYEDLGARDSYDTTSPATFPSDNEDILEVPLSEIALGRSGDKGGNLNFGLYVDSREKWDWLRTYMSRARVQELLGEDWRDEYSIERVEFPRIWAVHFVVYGILGRGVSSSRRLDGFGKGFVDYFRDKVVRVPRRVVDGR